MPSLDFTQKIVDASGRVVWLATYDSFGKAQIQLSEIENNMRFPGQYYDAETGFHYNYFRYYNPQTGRYIAPDPIGLEGGLNLFVYVQNNPINYVDPYGMWITCKDCVDISVATVVVWGKLEGTTSCFNCKDKDKPKDCTFDVIMHYKCSCWGLQVGGSVEYGGCLAESLSNLLSSFKSLPIGIGYASFTFTWSKKSGCVTGGVSLGVPPISGAICNCDVKSSIVSK